MTIDEALSMIDERFLKVFSEELVKVFGKDIFNITDLYFRIREIYTSYYERKRMRVKPEGTRMGKTDSYKYELLVSLIQSPSFLFDILEFAKITTPTMKGVEDKC